MRLRFKTPFHLSVALNVAVTLFLAAFAAIAAFLAINTIIDESLKEEIRRDIVVLRERAPESAVLPEAASMTANISRRLFAKEVEDSYSVYLLVRSDGTAVVGNATIWPNQEIATARWREIDGKKIGVAHGAILIRTEPIEGGMGLLVGRRLTARQALQSRFVPWVVFGFLIFGSVTSALLVWLDIRYRARVQAYNDVFKTIKSGDLSARVDTSPNTHLTDEFLKLGSNINDALAEVERLLAGLDSYSQVAAHELNLAVSNMRDRFIEVGDTYSIQEANRLLELVAHILELAKIEANPGFSMQRVSLNDIATSVTSLFNDAFEDKGVLLKNIFKSDNTEILCSRPLIESALSNLVSNALKHAPTGSQVTITIEKQDLNLFVSIQDEGSGVSDTDISELARQGRKMKSGGNGFGLPHVKAVAIRHGGKLTLENSSPGLRSTLSFKLHREI